MQFDQDVRGWTTLPYLRIIPSFSVFFSVFVTMGKAYDSLQLTMTCLPLSPLSPSPLTWSLSTLSPKESSFWGRRLAPIRRPSNTTTPRIPPVDSLSDRFLKYDSVADYGTSNSSSTTRSPRKATTPLRAMRPPSSLPDRCSAQQTLCCPRSVYLNVYVVTSR